MSDLVCIEKLGTGKKREYVAVLPWDGDRIAFRDKYVRDLAEQIARSGLWEGHIYITPRHQVSGELEGRPRRGLEVGEFLAYSNAYHDTRAQLAA